VDSAEYRISGVQGGRGTSGVSYSSKSESRGRSSNDERNSGVHQGSNFTNI